MLSVFRSQVPSGIVYQSTDARADRSPVPIGAILLLRLLWGPTRPFTMFQMRLPHPSCVFGGRVGSDFEERPNDHRVFKAGTFPQKKPELCDI